MTCACLGRTTKGSGASGFSDLGFSGLRFNLKVNPLSQAKPSIGRLYPHKRNLQPSCDSYSVLIVWAGITAVL